MKVIARRIFSSSKGNEVSEDAVHHGLSYHRVHYHDLKSEQFLSSNSIARLINLSRNWLKQGIEIRFINAKDNIKSYIKSLGLDDVLKFE